MSHTVSNDSFSGKGAHYCLIEPLLSFGSGFELLNNQLCSKLNISQEFEFEMIRNVAMVRVVVTNDCLNSFCINRF